MSAHFSRPRATAAIARHTLVRRPAPAVPASLAVVGVDDAARGRTVLSERRLARVHLLGIMPGWPPVTNKMNLDKGVRNLFVTAALAAVAFVAVGCTGTSEADGPSPEPTVVVTVTPDETVSPDATASPEASPTETAPEPSATEQAGLVVTKYEEEGSYTLVLAPLDADKPSLTYLLELTDLRDLENLPAGSPYDADDLWTVVVSTEIYDSCQQFDEYKDSAC
ncbi:hypothetical protein E1281_28435 [Actinomadura sp. KC345]|uniref:hypothetical protein n=1 Tax=Actinomadura sp. KC345 TaxID=2530371 RepID=UPI001049F20A|nr:hypothetical protein [Actinomadura sp. KC345]TDC46222.1 hypothetical protein E1281_28435 [Actinomadura sp. KC345]